MMIAHCGDAAFIDYAHRYGLAMCYWTVNTDGDVRALAAAGADVLMTDYPEKVYDIIHAG
ncbi:MAG: Glycerophosphoryl diester phosphodiesterase family protein [Firmicutes bacterium ADurb.Bin262]|nr:MAG: Glycerophosphoryl diester phosphodiesterase family protein [Firmicutes bacterium ADurb.Bin262]